MDDLIWSIILFLGAILAFCGQWLIADTFRDEGQIERPVAWVAASICVVLIAGGTALCLLAGARIWS